MPFWRCYAHLVWATKERKPLISERIEPRLHGQIASKAIELGCTVYAVNGMLDHVHVVLSVPPKYSLADIAKLLKGSSAHFVNQVLRDPLNHLQWQRGYGCFSLGSSQLAAAVAYVRNQKEHHAQASINRWLERVSDMDDGPPRTYQADGHEKLTG